MSSTVSYGMIFDKLATLILYLLCTINDRFFLRSENCSTFSDVKVKEKR